MSNDRDQDGVWRLNYFNYFTEVEEHFQRARGSGLFLLSPLDWALIEAWKDSGVPLEAVLRGIDAAFEKWRARRQRSQAVNGLAYCAQAVMKEAEAMANNLPSSSTAAEPPFPPEALRSHLEKSLASLRDLDGYSEVADAVEKLYVSFDEWFGKLQELDMRLTALEDKSAAIARSKLPDEALFKMRQELEAQLRPYRSKMTADQLSRLEKSFLDRKIFEYCRIPRLSLFYLR
jgi:hypothetical protein